MIDFIVFPLAFFGAYVLIGGPYTDNVTALGRKAYEWIKAKFN